MRAQYDQVWQGLAVDPRNAPEKRKLTTYLRWVDRGSWLWRPKYLFLDLSAQSTCAFLQFRLGSHDSQVERGRWEDGRPPHIRLCERCSMHKVDDERHLVFECPEFEDLRYARRHLFTATIGEDVRAFLNQRDQAGVLWFVLDCLKHPGPSPFVQELDCDLDLNVELDTFD